MARTLREALARLAPRAVVAAATFAAIARLATNHPATQHASERARHATAAATARQPPTAAIPAISVSRVGGVRHASPQSTESSTGTR